MASYGFSAPQALGTDEHFCSDNDLDMTGVGNDLYLVYKLKGVNDLYAVKMSEVVKDRDKTEMVWGAPVKTGQSSDSHPAIANLNGTIYVFWKKVDSNKIHYGIMDPTSLLVSDLGSLPEAETKTGVAATVLNGKIYITHIGKTTGISGRSIYQISFDGTTWSSDDEIHDQESKDAPVMCATATKMYLAHRGKTDGIAGNSLYWSANGTGKHGDWSSNKTVEKPAQKAESQHRPGGGIWKNSFVVIHNGNEEEKLRLVHMDLDENYWYGEDHIGDEFKSNNAAAFFSIGDVAYLVFADDEPSRTLKWSSSTTIH